MSGWTVKCQPGHNKNRNMLANPVIESTVKENGSLKPKENSQNYELHNASGRR